MESQAEKEAKRRVVAIVKESSDVRTEPSVPLRRYYRSLNEMYRMAQVYQSEGTLESALQLYVRFTSMWLEAVPKHPDYRSQDGAAEKAKAQGKLCGALDAADAIKKKLQTRYYADCLEQLKEEAQERAARAIPSRPSPSPPPTHFGFPPNHSNPPLSGYEGPPAVAPVSTGYAPKAEPILSDYPAVEDDRVPIPAARPSLNGGPVIPSAPQPSAPPPIPDRATKPTEAWSSSSGLRPLLVPGHLVQSFIRLADSNTARNVETCAILAGRLEANRLAVTALIVPEQTGTSDSCTTSGEEELFTVLDDRDLITLGWIHTHPSQTAFLSSVDMHAQASYQLMLPEAIAIVYSPKFAETGFFHLTPDGGLQEIGNCRATGFHPHSQVPPCFQVAPHVVTKEGLSMEIVDLRK